MAAEFLAFSGSLGSIMVSGELGEYHNKPWVTVGTQHSCWIFLAVPVLGGSFVTIAMSSCRP